MTSLWMRYVNVNRECHSGGHCRDYYIVAWYLSQFTSHFTIGQTLTRIYEWRIFTLQWRHNEWNCVSNHQPHDCLLNRLFRHRARKTSKPRITGLCEGNSPVTGEFPAQRACNAENVSIWWRHHDIYYSDVVIGQQDNSPRNHHQGDLPNCDVDRCFG